MTSEMRSCFVDTRVERVSGFLFVVFFMCVVCSFGICWVADFVGSPLASAFQMDRDRSILEGKNYANFPDLSMSSFVSTDFQAGVDSFINDRMPLRDQLLLFNAAWQRGLIAASAALHGYTVYPTFFGSSYCYDVAHDALYEINAPADQEAVERYEGAADAFARLAERHPDKRLFFYRVDRLSSSSNNPTSQLQNEVVDTEFLTEHFFDRLGGIEVIDGLQDGVAESLQVFFRSDHHWNGVPAYEAYREMLKELQPGIDPVDDVELVEFDIPLFQGSCARAGLCPVSVGDHIVDYVFDMSDYVVIADGKAVGPEGLQHLEKYETGGWNTDGFMNRYAEFWHGDFGMLRITNSEAATSKTLLIVRDSFGGPIERYFAEAYENVVVLDPRHSDTSVEDILSEERVDDVLFLMGSTNFATEATCDSLR